MLKSRRFMRFAGNTFAQYFKFVAATSRMVGGIEEHLETVAPHLPGIFTFWHGEQYLIPTAVAGRLPFSVLVSRHKDGEVQAAALEALGVPTIRGSGGRDRLKTMKKGGVRGSMEILSTLEAGRSVGLTSTVPKGAPREVGLGVVMMAKLSGRPIFPICHVTKHNVNLNTWDQSAINLPFSRSAFGLGKPFWIDCNADEKAIDLARNQIRDELNRITQEAYLSVGRE